MNHLKINIQLDARETGELSLSLPSSWNECPANIYPLLAELFLSPDEVITKYQKAVAALAILLGENYKYLVHFTAEEIYSMWPLIDWVFEKADITVNKTPVICPADYYDGMYGIELVSPADGFSNMRFAEWCAADTLYVEYSKSQDTLILNRLIAVIYRPKGIGEEFKPGTPGYRGDEREKFNDSLLDTRQKQIAVVPLPIKKGIYLWFAACRQELIKAYPLVFETETAEDYESKKLAEYGWFGVYDDLRGDPRFGGPDKLEDEFLHTFMNSMSRSEIKLRKYKKENGL